MSAEGLLHVWGLGFQVFSKFKCLKCGLAYMIEICSPDVSVGYVLGTVFEGAELFQNYPLITPGF